MASGPVTHVHWPEASEYSHRSFRSPGTSAEFNPSPPKTQKLPAASSQEKEPTRPPGTLPAAAVPCAPYTPVALAVLEPLIQLPRPVLGENSQRSFMLPSVPTAS